MVTVAALTGTPGVNTGTMPSRKGSMGTTPKSPEKREGNKDKFRIYGQ